MPVLSTRFSRELHERFLAECEKRETTPGELLRQMAEMVVEHRMNVDLAPSPVQQQIAALPLRADPGIRGYAMDGTPIPAGFTNRLKKKKSDG